MEKPLTRRKKIAFTAVALVLAALLATLSSEALVRSFKPQMTYSRLQVMVGDQYAPGEFIPFTLKANYQARMPSMESPGQTVSVSTNSFGLRGARNYFDDIKPRVRELGIDFVDLLAPMKARSERHFFPRNGEVHFNATGSAFAAEVLKEHLDLAP